jgi:hypothetical protein
VVRRRVCRKRLNCEVGGRSSWEAERAHRDAGDWIRRIDMILETVLGEMKG